MTPQPSTAVREAFASLPDEHRAVLQLARLGHSYLEIAERLGVAPALVSAWGLHAVLALTSSRRTGTGAITPS
jgi:DNA-directed RNA polymerase specialized sigma24 family protein